MWHNFLPSFLPDGCSIFGAQALDRSVAPCFARTEASYHGGCRYPSTSRNGNMATRNLFVRILTLVAFRESKRRDPRVPPVWIRRLRVIFVRIPKRAVVRRIYCHLTVIAPGKAGNLRTMSFDNRDLFARQLAQRVRGPSARIMN